MTDAEIIDAIQQPGRFDAVVGSETEALKLVRDALPQAIEVTRAKVGLPYPSPPPRARQWFQVHPAEPNVANSLPHVKYADWTGGKKGRGGSWGHIFFPEPIP